MKIRAWERPLTRVMIAVAIGIGGATVAAAGYTSPSPAVKAGLAVASAQSAARSSLLFERDLPAMDGSHLKLKVVDVHVAPGASSAPHRHGCAVVVYMVAGSMRMQVRGGRDSLYRVGETFYERPDDIHQMSANASATDPAHFTATFVCDRDGPLSTPVPDSR